MINNWIAESIRRSKLDLSDYEFRRRDRILSSPLPKDIKARLLAEKIIGLNLEDQSSIRRRGI